jgi:hypothetical protein
MANRLSFRQPRGQGWDDLPERKSRIISEPENVSDLSHRKPVGWHW